MIERKAISCYVSQTDADLSVKKLQKLTQLTTDTCFTDVHPLALNECLINCDFNFSSKAHACCMQRLI
jgi:hypothetical protein